MIANNWLIALMFLWGIRVVVGLVKLGKGDVMSNRINSEKAWGSQMITRTLVDTALVAGALGAYA